MLKMKKEQLKQAARLREENISASTAELSQKAIKATDTPSRVEDEQKAHEAKQAERHTIRVEDRKRLSKLQEEAKEKEKTDDDKVFPNSCQCLAKSLHTVKRLDEYRHLTI